MYKRTFKRAFGTVCLCMALVACAAPQRPSPASETGSTAKSGTNGGTTAPTDFLESSLPETSATTMLPTAMISTTAMGVTTTTTTQRGTTTTATVLPPVPDVNKEFCGVWVSHIELDSLLKNKSIDEIKAALDTIMQNSAAYGMNAVLLHVRANSDAYYKSAIFKTAAVVQNVVAQGFDPLAYAVQAAHVRGLQLHAWVNPYRIGLDTSYQKDDAVFYQIRSDGRKAWYYIPTSLSAQALIVRGVRELVDKYDIDGVHFDDYFYPNGFEPTVEKDFEKAPYEAYRREGGKLSLADWRRNHVDALISSCYAAVHRKKNVVFGVSPSHKISRNHDEMYADVEKWLQEEKYVDYLCPQVYFGFEHRSAAFDTTLKEWLALKRHPSVRLFVGVGIYKIGLSPDRYAGGEQDKRARNEWGERGDIMKRQVAFVRSQPSLGGMMFYSYSFLDASKRRGLSSWVEKSGTAYQQTYNQNIAEQEIAALLPLLLK